jgi:hypothetical protein
MTARCETIPYPRLIRTGPEKRDYRKLAHHRISLRRDARSRSDYNLPMARVRKLFPIYGSALANNMFSALTRGNITLPSAALRSSALVLMGSGIGSIPLKGLVGAISGVLQAVAPGKLKIETKVVPLTDVDDAWNKDSGASRVVFVVRQKFEASASL